MTHGSPMSTDPTKDHSRVSPQGKAMGANLARIAERGRARLKAQGLSGLGLPVLRDEMCKSCAARPGTVPNGCLQTQMDILKAATEGARFLCHAPADGRLCAGWAAARAELVANPLPAKAQELIARWDYSPPDTVDEATTGTAEEKQPPHK